MPIYQYQCDQCQHQLEALQKISDPKLTDCPQCSAPALRKQVTAAAFKLKGTGWYETDFKNSGKQPEQKSDSKTEVGTESKTAPKAESKTGKKNNSDPQKSETKAKTATG